MLPFWLAGLYQGWKLRINKKVKVMWWWLLIGPLPSALTQGGGNHAIRLFVWIPAIVFFISLGMNEFFNWLKKAGRSYLMWGWFFVVCLSALFYAERYFWHNSQTHYPDWQYGLKPALEYAKLVENEYDQIIVTRSFVHLPMLYYVFYDEYEPEILHKLFVNSEEVGILPPTEMIGKYRFMTITENDSYRPANSLYIASPWDKPEGWGKVKELYSPDPMNNKPLLLILENR